jgi:hypothetical protein
VGTEEDKRCSVVEIRTLEYTEGDLENRVVMRTFRLERVKVTG